MGKGKNETAEQRERRLAYNREWNRKNRKEESKKKKAKRIFGSDFSKWAKHTVKEKLVLIKETLKDLKKNG